MALLDQVGHRQSVVAKPCRDGDDEPHMRRGELVQGVLVAQVLPADRQRVLVLAREERRIHRRLDEGSPHARDLAHGHSPD